MTLCMKLQGKVFNLSTVEKFVREMRAAYTFTANVEYIYGYDIEFFRKSYDDSLSIAHIFDVLEIYAKLYFIYIAPSSLIIANYSVRTESENVDEGHSQYGIMSCSGPRPARGNPSCAYSGL